MYRRKLKHSRVKNLFKFASQKNNATCLVESALEYDACFHFEYSPNIKSFEAQPLGFHYVYEDRKFPYTPDFLLHYNDGGQKYLEIKTAKELSKLEVRQRFEMKKLAAVQRGVELIAVTENQIRVFPILDNLKLLHRYSGFQSLSDLHTRVIDLVRRTGNLKVSQLVEFLMMSACEVLSVVARLLCLGRLFTNLTESSLSLNSMLWVTND